MSRRSLLWLTVLLPLQGMPGLSPARALADLERQVLRAEVMQDQEFFRQLELCGYRFVGWRGEELTKAEDLEAVAAPRGGRVVAFGVDQLIVRIYGRTALVWGRDTIVIADARGANRVSRSRFTHVFLRHAGRWRLAAAHSSPVGTR